MHEGGIAVLRMTSYQFEVHHPPDFTLLSHVHGHLLGESLTVHSSLSPPWYGPSRKSLGEVTHGPLRCVEDTSDLQGIEV